MLILRKNFWENWKNQFSRLKSKTFVESKSVSVCFVFKVS